MRTCERNYDGIFGISNFYGSRSGFHRQRWVGRPLLRVRGPSYAYRNLSKKTECCQQSADAAPDPASKTLVSRAGHSAGQQHRHEAAPRDFKRKSTEQVRQLCPDGRLRGNGYGIKTDKKALLLRKFLTLKIAAEEAVFESYVSDRFRPKAAIRSPLFCNRRRRK
ncbi:hypothetical protein [Aliirhizobium cellulosilyticum]|uniref:Uncharacterized protein n=1 Tax=Aliirhizobium cellulosilyticum TaxID=393664 RepID=A0A7W6XCL4_9HYPH|nr:hypothetical protein [Rhizobium cellulosilyticum]MBB4350725.1 hypothetical protein [Rhizobium cellulosilyticum]MBB4413920.1 hypothetical protein [Rhizobium cellulosilyticum]MBB4448535.1 hypothetical protein [Rhizobium cellulosilyticum]